ncbi:exported hypothetical protein [Candidatus Nitrospira nitrificans]|uniref:Uncharacterized protein n=1 Tax=Candidatus Nitrospira nitrificans TaxID=1742973 RepID=A0A0S4LR75_9BACT|nr:exported hypothetical protein [Candidatus Nitrospira nitrificans]
MFSERIALLASWAVFQTLLAQDFAANRDFLTEVERSSGGHETSCAENHMTIEHDIRDF